METTHSWLAHKASRIRSILFTNGDNVWSCGDTDICVWDKMSRAKLKQLNFHSHRIQHLSIIKTESMFVVCSCSRDKTIAFWDPKKLKFLGKQEMEDEVLCLLESQGFTYILGNRSIIIAKKS
eukprot:TRINITY_DN5037_c0_g1_i1.p1 TRINITY_DN5037_c0_g1~~TRINITY_DN5037_c0_g1_i1.p1  ORF type:complete len:123 (-),score=11.54 TRINITY_DN5037_c0_g1_i1:35-403(-)